MADKDAGRIKKILLPILGLVLLIAGIVLILKWWAFLAIVFKGVSGIALALVGMLVLFLATKE